jgi:hypothetical protein
MTTIKTQNRTPAAERTADLLLLTDGELCRVVGGNDRATKVHFSDIHFTKTTDASSPLLLLG